MEVSGLDWDEPDDLVSQNTTRLQVELAECVETKTITTTTTTKRSYPPLIVRPPRSLYSLDAREYPLALKPTPRELTNFSFEIDGKIVHLCEDVSTTSGSTVCITIGYPICHVLYPAC
jgi:F-box and WD-40 domain protein CDC4